jgi:hypothetical protein
MAALPAANYFSDQSQSQKSTRSKEPCRRGDAAHFFPAGKYWDRGHAEGLTIC